MAAEKWAAYIRIQFKAFCWNVFESYYINFANAIEMQS